MNFSNQICFLILTLCYTFVCSFSNGQEYQIEYLSVEDGLSHNKVTSIVQDKYGFMWFGTNGGLNRYDGYQFKHYKPNREQVTSIQNASVESLFRDSADRLWVGTQSGGYSYYDVEKDIFVVPPGADKLNKNPVVSFNEDASGNIFISSLGQGVIKYSPDSNNYEKLTEDGFCRAVTCVNDSMIFYGTQQGLTQIGLDTVVKTFNLINGYHEPMKMVVDRHNPYIWIVGWRLNLVCYNYLNGNSEIIKIPGLQDDLDAGISLMQDADGDLWIGTIGKGLYKFNVGSSHFQRIDIKRNLSSLFNRDHDVILDIFQDEAGCIWLGTDGGGIVKITKRNQFFTHQVGNTDEGQHITAVLEDDNGVLWVGTKGNGLFMRDEKGQFTKIINQDLSVVNDFESNYVRSIYQSKDGVIWVGLESNLFVVQKNNSGRMELVRAAKFHDSPNLYTRKPISIAETETLLWIATEQTGLHVFEKNAGKYVLKKRIESKDEESKLISTTGMVLHADNQKRLWLGTKNGLYMLHSEDDSFTSLTSLLSDQNFLFDNTILCLHTDNNGHLWFGTPSSLNQLVNKSDGGFQVIEYDINDGLSDDYINSILSDDEGNIWVSTNAGLSMFNQLDQTFMNYDMSDGLADVSYSEASGYKGKDGRLYFGGQSRLTYFLPSEITDNVYNPPIVVTEFKILNKPVSIGDQGVLTENINEQQRISLNHYQNEFSLELAALDYKAPGLNQYAYWLEGRDSSRVMMGNRRYISFSNLKPGAYTLHLYATNSNGLWSKHERSIRIKVSAAPWKTWYATVIYVLVIVLIVYLIMRVARRQGALSRDVEMQRKLRENQKQLNEEKLRFFTNVSHEIRTPLTLILAPVNELLQKDLSKVGHSFVRNKAEIVQQNTNRLLTLVNQLLEFRKVEEGQVTLRASENNIIEFIKQLSKPFEAYATSKKIKYTCNYKLSEPSLFFDNEKMAVVINNLLANAIKYAGEPGVVSISVSDGDDSSVLIRISNNGSGIPSSSMELLFDRFYQNSGSATVDSSGIGLSLVKSFVELHKGEVSVKSAPNELTTFTIELLKGKEHLLPDQIIERPTEAETFESIIKNEPEPLPKQNKGIKNAKVLIVEDNEEVRNYLNDFLEDYFNVIVAKDGLEGYKSAIEHKPELVISDVMMPRMDGFELCQKIKSNAQISHIPIILLTAKAEQKDEMLGTTKGADAYLTKPFDAGMLLVKINMLIDSRRKLSDKYADKVVLAPEDKELEKDDAKFLKKIMAILEENIGNIDFTKELLADKMAMSDTTLFRRCKKLVNLSPSAFIKSIRLKRAAQLLRDSDLTVTEIMDAVAYVEIKTFRRNFIKEFKMSPSDYRKQHKK
ncbi:two-component regulator propeller domain-containing protein [Draconibacterium sp. IB214405]|uniref:hybrid sensor histidine kinase/response regulator transcription factor n=1 Tax=Draconibacterium sp. IB214405 TaxID=3097352 RepID=UPI002A120570|nr:two-component regulator propeller domain-containing protein [Draconibacterium sp. IB214405]MDX8340702.1 two-component regulator propeller domain-containing protein [Draconibacterium sp. IB214405]